MVLRALVIQNSVETVASPELVRETRFSTGSVLAQVMERATGLSKELATQASNEAERTAPWTDQAFSAAFHASESA